ncbi:palmitoyl transferase [Enterobacter sp. BIGb0383]|uniref:lipid IV(A) palmitoyltransferase PagP n=1 Tax=unclassified Enterobacter TaxID=2608935 RepID=UPI000F47DE5B|nr:MULTISPECIES: lipid IV(A) palmitoyltransferase PagP [unclassified Enterobacter]ROP62623.1 palmitoyl transferase [Enterobacter sp. BIGb0383]ROS12784.1 palmitoyl transferase [Enterobacter sp. BIGb0359]
MRHPLAVLWGTLIIGAVPAHAVEKVYGESRIRDWWNHFTDDVSQTWHQPQHYDLYVPFLSWHNRLTYDKDKTDDYNEMPWGGGVGMSRYDSNGDWSALYAMMFKDSHNMWQPMIGYGWEKGWYPAGGQDFRLGLGLTAGITARDDFANYVPLPLVLPLFSAGYKRVNLQFTYIPGTHNNGNVLFAWMRFAF